MSWWKPLVLLVVPPLVVVALQIALYPVVDAIEGNDPLAPTLTPLRLLAVNLSVAASALLTIVLLVRMTGAPWRSLLSAPAPSMPDAWRCTWPARRCWWVPVWASPRSSRPARPAGPPSGSPARPLPSWWWSC
jgi:hypothetical protein